jgi:predicted ATPase
MLRTLGGLALEGELQQTKPLLLLCYVALEGASSREHLATLFWPGAARPLSNLSVALHTLGSRGRSVISATRTQVTTSVRTDLHAFFDHLDADEEGFAAALYRGPFLLGVDGAGVGSELEEWILATREFVARRYQDALLRWALDRSASDPAGAGSLAHAALKVKGAPAADHTVLTTVYRVLAGADHPSAPLVRDELRDLGVAVVDVPPTAPRPDRQAPGAPGSVRPRPPSSATALGVPRSGLAIVGRDPERIAVAGLLGDPENRLVTLLGPGGIGKTRLAMQVTLDLAAAGTVTGGQLFLSLANAQSPSDVALSLALLLGAEPRTTSAPAEALAALVPRGPTLLVMDDVEQVSGLRSLVDDLLAACPDLTVLATSREVIGSEHEVPFLLSGLPVPGVPVPGQTVPGHDPLQVRAESFDSVRLFVQRATRADPTFSLDDGALPHVVSICRTVQGSPLGIELAAAWIRTLPAEEIARELGADIDFLRRPDAGGAPRHDSARASFERSWRRLGPREASALAALSQFHGGFLLTHARAVAACSIAVIASLVDKSLLQLVDGRRYEMHPLVLRFAREKLASRPKLAEAVASTHAASTLAVLGALGDGVRALDRGALSRVDDEFANVRHAWQHAVAAADTDGIRNAALVLARYCDARARLVEGREMLLAAASVAWVGTRDGLMAAGRSQVGLAWLEVRLDDVAAAERHCDTGLRLLIDAGDEDAIPWAKRVSASVRYKHGDYRAALALFTEVVDGAVDPVTRADGLGRLGLVEQALGRYEDARAHYLAALGLHRSHADMGGVITQLLNLGALELNSASPDRASVRFEEALRLAQAHGYEQVVPILLHNLANVACKSRAYVEARTMAHDALERVRRSGERGLQSGMLATLAWIELEAGDAVTAEEHAHQAILVARDCTDEPAEQTARLRLGQVWLALGRREEAHGLLSDVEAHGKTLTWTRRLAERLRTGVAN